MTRIRTNPSKSTWTIRQMFLWVFIVALILPYIVAMVPRQARTLDAMPLTAKPIEELLREIDPSAKVSCIGSNATSRGDLSQVEFDHLVTMKNASDYELFRHLRKRFSDQIKKSHSQFYIGDGSESYTFIASDGYFRRHLYLWYSPPNPAYGALEPGEKGMRIKVLQIEYRTR